MYMMYNMYCTLSSAFIKKYI